MLGKRASPDSARSTKERYNLHVIGGIELRFDGAGWDDGRERARSSARVNQ